MKHGHSRGHRTTPEYTAWIHMINRCYSPSNKRYRHYGGRGIRVCDRWRESFASFFSDIGPRPVGKFTLDRVNNDGDYEPSNCRWTTYSVQNRNHRRNRTLTMSGETLCLKDWANKYHIDYTTFRRRMESGFAPQLALTMDSAADGGWHAIRLREKTSTRTTRKIIYLGRTQTVQQWAAEFGRSGKTVNARLKAGWAIGPALTIPPARPSRRRPSVSAMSAPKSAPGSGNA